MYELFMECLVTYTFIHYHSIGEIINGSETWPAGLSKSRNIFHIFQAVVYYDLHDKHSCVFQLKISYEQHAKLIDTPYGNLEKIWKIC